MTDYNAVKPNLTGVDCGPVNPAASGDKLISGGRTLFILENSSLAAITLTLEDARTAQPEGATAQATFADLTVSCPASDRRAFLVQDVTRFRATADEKIALTWSATADMAWKAYEV